MDTLRDEKKEVIAIDGKTSRRSHARAKGREPLHLVSAWATRQSLVLGQEAVVDKSKEIVAIPLLLHPLELTGAFVTIDAMGTQDTIADVIVGKAATTCSRSRQTDPFCTATIRRRRCPSIATSRRRGSWVDRGAPPQRLPQGRPAVLGPPRRGRGPLPRSRPRQAHGHEHAPEPEGQALPQAPQKFAAIDEDHIRPWFVRPRR